MSTARSQYTAAISDSLALWTVLKERAGLSIASAPDKEDYDDALVDDLKTALFPSEAGLFDVLLEEHHLTVSTSELLRAFLSALQPLSMMQRDILEMLSAASAPLGEDALRVGSTSRVTTR